MVRQYINGEQVVRIDPDVLRAEVDVEAYRFVNRQVDIGRITRTESYDLICWYDDEKV